MMLLQNSKTQSVRLKRNINIVYSPEVDIEKTLTKKLSCRDN